MKSSLQLNPSSVSAVRVLLKKYGYDSLSYFSLQDNRKYFFSSSGRSFLSYKIWKNVALISADPIGPIEETEKLLKEFIYFTKGAKLKTCFIGLAARNRMIVKKLQFKTVKVGEEAIMQLSYFNKQYLRKKVRRAEKYVQRLGITCLIFSRAQIPQQYLKQIEEISAEWLQQKGNKERGFSMSLGRIPSTLDADCEFILAIQENTVLGYLSMVPIYGRNSWSLDAMRKRKNTPNGLMEFLILQALDYYKQKKSEIVSLNFATFMNSQKEYGKIKRAFLSCFFTPLSAWYKCRSLYAFNNKFLPQWQSRYIAVEGLRFIPLFIVAIAIAELGNLS